MAITRGSFTSGDNPPTPSKNFVQGKASGPAVTGNYADAASAASDSDAPSSANDAKAEAVYGQNAGRMSRIESISQEASEDSTGDGSTSSTGPAFIDGNTASGFKQVGGSEDNWNGFGAQSDSYPQAADVPGSPGFPGGDQYQVDNDKLPARPPVRVSKSTTGTSGANPGANPAVSGYPGFPGLP